MKTIKTTATILCSLILGVIIGAFFVGRSYYHSMSSRCFVGAADSLIQLQQLRSGNVDSAIQHLEVNLDGDLIGLWVFYKDTKPERRDPHVLKLLDKIRDYRQHYPRTTEHPDLDKSVAEVLTWHDSHNQ